MFTAMQTTTQVDEAVQQKTIELCETIVQQPQFQSIRQRVDAFMADAKAQQQYQSLTEKGVTARAAPGFAAGSERSRGV